MKRYKVQWAWAKEISNPVFHTVEAAASKDVRYYLGTWILKNLEQNMAMRTPVIKDHPELEEGIRFLIPEIKRLMGANMVWEAYDLWEDFYLRFENETGNPLFIEFGTVIVEGSENTGLKNRIALMDPGALESLLKGTKPKIIISPHMQLINRTIREVLEVAANKALLKGIKFTEEQVDNAVGTTMRVVIDKYPYMYDESKADLVAELREGILRKLFPKPAGIGLGALKRWHVQYADFGGAWHPGHHTNEERAKHDAKQYLTTLLHHLSVHADAEARTERNPEYVTEADHLAGQIQYWLDNDAVWAAYLEYKAFEKRWNHHFYPFTLEMSIGSMRVIPEPEPEQTL